MHLHYIWFPFFYVQASCHFIEFKQYLITNITTVKKTERSIMTVHVKYKYSRKPRILFTMNQYNICKKWRRSVFTNPLKLQRKIKFITRQISFIWYLAKVGRLMKHELFFNIYLRALFRNPMRWNVVMGEKMDMDLIYKTE